MTYETNAKLDAIRYAENTLDEFYSLKALNENQKLELKRNVRIFFDRDYVETGSRPLTVAASVIYDSFKEKREELKIPKLVGRIDDVIDVIKSLYENKMDIPSIQSVNILSKKIREEKDNRPLLTTTIQ